ncbi:MAG: PCI domain-containing protein [Candidatus Thorarchaeota archaeon]|jgi:hypothetical protein
MSRQKRSHKAKNSLKRTIIPPFHDKGFKKVDKKVVVRDIPNMKTTYRFDHRNVPITLFLFGLAFLVIGSINILQPTLFGSPWMLIPGLIFIGTGVGILLMRDQTKEDVKRALESYNRVSLKQLSSELNMDREDLASTIMDLRNDGEILARFDYTSDTVIIETRSQ